MGCVDPHRGLDQAPQLRVLGALLEADLKAVVTLPLGTPAARERPIFHGGDQAGAGILRPPPLINSGTFLLSSGPSPTGTVSGPIRSPVRSRVPLHTATRSLVPSRLRFTLRSQGPPACGHLGTTEWKALLPTGLPLHEHRKERKLL